MTLAINLDELGQKLEETIPILKDLGIRHIELRMLNQKNIVYFDDKELYVLKNELKKHSIEAASIASPIFKWYKHHPLRAKKIDNFSVPYILKNQEKRFLIERIIYIANVLNVKNIRIFSNIFENKPNKEDFIQDPLLEHAINLAKKQKINLLLENEPVCNIRTSNDVLYALNSKKNLGLWLDIANLYYIKESLTTEELIKLLPYIKYVHLKDFIFKNNAVHHVPLGDGCVPWDIFLPKLLSLGKNIIFSLESHVKNNPAKVAKKSIQYFHKQIRKTQNEN